MTLTGLVPASTDAAEQGVQRITANPRWGHQRIQGELVAPRRASLGPRAALAAAAAHATATAAVRMVGEEVAATRQRLRAIRTAGSRA